MAISFYRAFFQTARVASEPAIKIIKRIHMNSHSMGAHEDFLIGFGRVWHRFERMLTYNKGGSIELSRDAALTKGI